MIAAPLRAATLVAFVSTTDLARARAFYRDVLGLVIAEDTPFACVLDSGTTTLRVTLVESLAPAAHTVLGWTVADIATTVDELTARDVPMIRFEGMSQDERGIWTAPGGARVAWFNDPDQNVLSVTQLVA